MLILYYNLHLIIILVFLTKLTPASHFLKQS